MRPPRWRLVLLLGVLILVVGLYVERASRPLLPKSYNILLFSGEENSKISVDKVTHIRSRGFCSEIWNNDILDTIVCTPHIVTEIVAEEPAKPEGRDEVSREEKR